MHHQKKIILLHYSSVSTKKKVTSERVNLWGKGIKFYKSVQSLLEFSIIDFINMYFKIFVSRNFSVKCVYEYFIKKFYK